MIQVQKPLETKEPESSQHVTLKLEEEATWWIARLRSDLVCQKDKQAFSRWLNVSDAHIQAFDRVMEIWESTAAVQYLPFEELCAAEVDKDIPSITPKPISDSDQRTNLPQESFLWKSKSWVSGFAVACVAILAALVYTTIDFSKHPTPSVFEYRTAAGEQKRFELPDGSTLELNTHSAVKVSYSAEQRLINLVEGEVYFQVRSNKQRPFIVDVGQGTVTSIGTAFNIYRQAHETTVTVTEGVVGIREKEDASTPNPEYHHVKADQQIRFNKYGLDEVATADKIKATAWRDKTLIFDNITLASALTELNRYLPNPVDAEHPSLATLRVSGTFSVGAPEATLQALINSFNLETEQSSPTAPLSLKAE